MPLHRPFHPAWTLCAVLLTTAGAATLAGRWMLQHSLAEENLLAHRQVSLYAQALAQRIDRYRALPDVLALDPELRAALVSPPAASAVRQLNQKLERANGASQASTLTLINQTGIAVAASNWQTPHSNVGENYSFRPYVQEALQQDKGSFYGIGVTTGEAGYFLSRGIHDAGDRIVGLIVIKIALQELEREWIQTPDTVFATDANGVVFLASDPAWRYRLLHPLSPSAQQAIERTQQYGNETLHPLQMRILQSLDQGGELVHWQTPALGDKLLQAVDLPETRWQLHIIHDVNSSHAAAWWAASAAGGAWLALALLVLYVRQRQRLSALRQRSREELEALLQQHAQELRTAQDGIVAAAKQADAGKSQSLEHLPQGVIVVDAALNLVAWNSRYRELFRLPAGMLKVGMPVEELYRFNARRGLLGRGQQSGSELDGAIERRMQYLRSGQPHARESEKADGTVLEIRGNPLPGGGFVTSYADITSYKNAARELRSLADALEKRIADRTQDLAEAKREAEQANRSKSKFVAAAVHDLLQPLNAARVFVSLLRQHVPDGPALKIASQVEGALAAQDDILGSLLDLSRMESGQMEVHWADFALQPLLQQLGNNLGVIAQEHGLELHVVASQATVHSDPVLLRRIVQNFVSNAIRYTRRGKIVLGCRRSGAHVRIEVHDQGPGIPESLQTEIFEEFRRLETGHQHDRGAGLGLSIVQRLGRLLGHEIGLRSELGRGSVFWVSVPLAQAAPSMAPPLQIPPQNAPQHDAPLQGASAWCIDESAEASAALAALLQRWGCSVPLAGNAQAALAALAIAAPQQAPQLLLLGAHATAAPVQDLYQQLCQAWGQRPQAILVGDEHDAALRRLAADRGWGFLRTPVRPAALRALASQMLLRRGDASHTSESGESEAPAQ
ncbi:PAS-domain containing protein [Comamonas odontotermitis]|uniref:PAS-domain containing protein n=1 Tax=Comamonas odontotermitis TaxID=379895 RepID=UPI001CC78296|nr:PAS-domain containing protein [Comamonas odontotermitis]UBB19445.1 PAS-domain containing protein [Comamonas odontotermitis]